MTLQEEIRAQRVEYKTPVKAPISAAMPQLPVARPQGPPAPVPGPVPRPGLPPPGPAIPPQPMNMPPRMPPPQPFGVYLTDHLACLADSRPTVIEQTAHIVVFVITYEQYLLTACS